MGGAGEFVDIPLQSLSGPSAAIDHTTHQARLDELIHRPATPPPFGTDLPPRYTEIPKKKFNIYKLIIAILVVLLLVSVIPLAVILAREHTIAVDLFTVNRELAASNSELAFNNQTITVSKTQTSFVVNTTTLSTTATTTHEITTMSLSIFTQVVPVPTTITVTPTLDPNGPLFVGSHRCLMVNEANRTQFDTDDPSTEQFDCQDFCSLNPDCEIQFCKQDRLVNMEVQRAGCCIRCNCAPTSCYSKTCRLLATNIAQESPTGIGGL